MNDVFLLGAGFSKAIATTMPTMAELYAELEPLIGTADGFTRDAYDYAAGNVETLLSYYAIPSPHDDMVEVLRKRRVTALLEIGIGEFLRGCEEQAVSEGLNVRGRDLVSRWHEKNSHILTTNYDTIVERLLDDWRRTLPSRERPSLADVQPIPVSSALARDGTGLIGSDDLETLTLYKIHGSINWFRSESDTNTDTIYSLPPQDLSDAGQMKYVRDKRRFIVPPVYDKSSLLNHDSIRSLWRQAKMNALVPAARLFVIGYSLPETDVAMRTLLWEGRRLGEGRRRIPLYVVDTDGTVVQRYRDALGRYYDIRGDYAGGEDAFDQFVDSYLAP